MDFSRAGMGLELELRAWRGDYCVRDGFSDGVW